MHHASQYLITNGYDNREGIDAIVGSEESSSGLNHALSLHERLKIPPNLHLSGTLVEALAWFHPQFLKYVRSLLETGLIEVVGSAYGPNIMRFFSQEYNRRQPVQIADWAARTQEAGPKKIQRGTFQELANDFDAGEGHERPGTSRRTGHHIAVI